MLLSARASGSPEAQADTLDYHFQCTIQKSYIKNHHSKSPVLHFLGVFGNAEFLDELADFAVHDGG